MQAYASEFDNVAQSEGEAEQLAAQRVQLLDKVQSMAAEVAVKKAEVETRRSTLAKNDLFAKLETHQKRKQTLAEVSTVACFLEALDGDPGVMVHLP